MPFYQLVRPLLTSSHLAVAGANLAVQETMSETRKEEVEI